MTMTPGPWRQGTGKDRERVYEWGTTDIIAMPGQNFSIINPSQTLEANARAIAALPDILAALPDVLAIAEEETLGLYETASKFGDDDIEQMADKASLACERLRVAMEKAGGKA